MDYKLALGGVVLLVANALVSLILCLNIFFFFHTTGVTGGVDINFDLSLLYLLLYKFLF